VGGPTARTGRVLRMGLSIHRAHLRRNLAPMIPPSTTQGSDYRLAELRLQMGDVNGAIQAYYQILRLDPDNTWARKGLLKLGIMP
jgi:predicted TPR repeat methyltransferase